MIILTKNGRSLINRPAAFDGRDAIAPPGCVPYQPDPEKVEAPRVQLEASGTEHQSPQKDPGVGILHDAQRQRKAFVTHQAKFARLGFELNSKQHPAGVTLFEVSRHGQTRIFSHWGDVGAFLTQLQGVRHV